MKKRTNLVEQSTSTKTWEEGIKEFSLSCKAKNLSPSTIKYYNLASNLFVKHTHITYIHEINIHLINKFIIELQDGHKVSSVNTNLRAIRAILYFFMELDYLPKFKVKLLKQSEEIKETYTDAEIALLLKKPNIKKCSFAEYRDWVIINFFIGTGCRIRTLRNIKLKDLDLDNANITLRVTKNKKPQIIPASKTLIKVLTEYLKYRQATDAEDYLFCNVYGNIIQQRSLQQSIQIYNKKRGVAKTSAHLLRHTFAKNWILSGGDIFRLQKILGHSSLDMVRNYVNMYGDDLKDNFDKFNPLEKFNCNNSVIKMR